MKRILIGLLIFNGAINGGEMSQAIRKSDVESVKKFIEDITNENFQHYSNLADQIISLRKEQLTTGELAYSIGRSPISEDVEGALLPRLGKAAGVGCLGYGIYLMVQWIFSIEDNVGKPLSPMVKQLLMSYGLIAISPIVIAHSNRRVFFLKLQYLKKNYENSLIVKDMIFEKYMARR